MKTFNKWTRKLHRWVSIPTFLLIPLMVFVKLTHAAYFRLPPQFELAQSFLMLFLAISGAYLYFMPYIAKSKRKKRQRSN